MTTIVKAANAAEFLSLVPRLLGYHPTDSLVLVPFDGARTCGAMRFDLPRDGDEIERLAATFLGLACKIPDADGIAVVAFTSATFADGIPHAGLVRAIETRADACGLRVVDALCVAADAWGSYLTEHGEARPLAQLGDAAPAFWGDFPEPADDQSAGAELPVIDDDTVGRVADALRSLGDAVTLLCESGARTDRRIDPQALATACVLEDLPRLFERALGWDAEALAPYDAAAMIWCLERPSLRDIAMVGWCGGVVAGDEALEAQLRWEQGAEYPAHLAMVMWGEGDRPEPGRLQSALTLTRTLAALCPEPRRAGALAMCGWLSWALGKSTHAALYAGWACEIEPEHGLAEIVASFVGAGHLPEWAFTPARASAT
jgi:hypothetical protein